MDKKDYNDNVEYVFLQPMTREEAELAFNSIDPLDLKRFIFSMVDENKNAILTAKSYDEVQYYKGKIDGLKTMYNCLSQYTRSNNSNQSQNTTTLEYNPHPSYGGLKFLKDN